MTSKVPFKTNCEWYDRFGINDIFSHLARARQSKEPIMSKDTFRNSKILVVGGAGFVGSNLVLKTPRRKSSRKILVVDNLLSSEACNVPVASNVRFLCGSITDDAVLRALPTDLRLCLSLGLLPRESVLHCQPHGRSCE